MPTTSSLLKTAESARKKKLAYDDDVAAFVFQNSAKTQQDWDEYQDYLRTRQTSAPTGSEKLSYAKKLKSAEDSYVSAEIERTSIDILDGKGTTLDKYNKIGSLYERAVERGNMDLAQNLYYQAKRLEEQMINEQERAQRVAGAMATNGVKDIKKLIQKLQTSPDTVAISPTEAYKSLDQIGRELKTNGDTDAGFWNDAKLTTQAITDLVKDAYESASNQEVIDYIENDTTLRGVYMGEKAFKIGGQSLSLDEVDLAFPMEQPNATQTWSDVWALYKTYMKLTGNCYFYLLSPEEGANAGVPVQLYVLPAHLMQIVLKPKANMLSTESPIDHYVLIEGNVMIKFMAKDVIHIKYSNPNFDLSGSHLYGMSPLRAALRNINSSNSGIDLNVKTLQNGGAFGFIHGKGTPLSVDQANSLKERLVEMDASPERLSRIAGASGELAFTRISLTTDELKPFDYLKFDQKAICNVLNWPDELLNNDGKSKLGSTDTNQARKQAITDNILPDLVLLHSSINAPVISNDPKLSKFGSAGYKNKSFKRISLLLFQVITPDCELK